MFYLANTSILISIANLAQERKEVDIKEVGIGTLPHGFEGGEDIWINDMNGDTFVARRL